MCQEVPFTAFLIILISQVCVSNPASFAYKSLYRSWNWNILLDFIREFSCNVVLVMWLDYFPVKKKNCPHRLELACTRERGKGEVKLNDREPVRLF